MLNRVEDAILQARLRRRGAANASLPLAMTLLGIVGAVGGAIVTACVLLPAALILPLTGAALVVAAITLAVIALASPDEVGRARIIFWDIAAALLLIGLCAGLWDEATLAVASIESDR
jgi:predicted benzoate:H+ symporter BenE